MSAAADLIYEHGVERTSLDDVMAASGVSKSQLYHYFADKDALVLEVIAFQTGRVLDSQKPHLGALDSFRAGGTRLSGSVETRKTRAAHWDRSLTS